MSESLDTESGPSDDWWDCPKCGSDTNVIGGGSAVENRRECIECDWSVTIPTQEEA